MKTTSRFKNVIKRILLVIFLLAAMSLITISLPINFFYWIVMGKKFRLMYKLIEKIDSIGDRLI